MTASALANVLVTLADLFERLGIRYHVGGSIASGRHGTFRPTLDVDLVIDIGASDLDTLEKAFAPRFFVGRTAMEEAVAKRGSFSAFDLETSFKIDFHLMGARPFDREEMRRASPELVLRDAKPIVTKSAEDVVLRQLEWFRMRGEVSETHWRDVLGVLTAQAGRLNQTYLDTWAAELRVADLLGRAREQARVS